MAAPAPFDWLAQLDAAAKQAQADADLAAHPERNRGALADLGTDIKAGAWDTLAAVPALADMPTAALTGYAPVSAATGWIGEQTGFQPTRFAEEAAQEYTPERQAAEAQKNAAWDESRYGDYALSFLEHPIHNIGGLLARSAPSMLAGGFLGRGLGAVAGAIKGAPTISKYMAMTNYAAGEGLVSGAMSMQQSLEQGVDPRTAGLMALGTTATTGALGFAGGTLAHRMGLETPEQILAGSRLPVDPTRVVPGLGARVAGGAAIEGLVAEMPQSGLEQMWQNVATGAPLTQDVARQAIEGAIAGTVMGGAFNVRGPGQVVVPNPPPPGGVPPPATPAAPPPLDLTVPPTTPEVRSDESQESTRQEVPGQGPAPDVREGQDADVQERGQGESPLLTGAAEPLAPQLAQAAAQLGLRPIAYDTFESKIDPQTGKQQFGGAKVSGTAPIVSMADRMIAQVDINGVLVPFYLSTGHGGKAGVPVGKWYPVFGLAPSDGWLNKTHDAEIVNYYGSAALRNAAETLDSTIGDIRGNKGVPKVLSGALAAHINSGLGVVGVENGTSITASALAANIQAILQRIEAGKATTPSAAPAADPAQAQADALAAQQAVAAIQQQKAQTAWQKRRADAVTRLDTGKPGLAIYKADELAAAQADPDLTLAPMGTKGGFRVVGVRNPDTDVWTGQPPIIEAAPAALPSDLTGGANALEVPQAGSPNGGLRAPVGSEVGQGPEGPVPVAEGSQGVREGGPESQEAPVAARLLPPGTTTENAGEMLVQEIGAAFDDPLPGKRKGKTLGERLDAQAAPDQGPALRQWMANVVARAARAPGGTTGLADSRALASELATLGLTTTPVSHTTMRKWAEAAGLAVEGRPTIPTLATLAGPEETAMAPAAATAAYGGQATGAEAQEEAADFGDGAPTTSDDVLAGPDTTSNEFAAEQATATEGEGADQGPGAKGGMGRSSGTAVRITAPVLAAWKEQGVASDRHGEGHSDTAAKAELDLVRTAFPGLFDTFAGLVKGKSLGNYPTFYRDALRRLEVWAEASRAAGEPVGKNPLKAAARAFSRLAKLDPEVHAAWDQAFAVGIAPETRDRLYQTTQDVFAKAAQADTNQGGASAEQARAEREAAATAVQAQKLQLAVQQLDTIGSVTWEYFRKELGLTERVPEWAGVPEAIRVSWRNTAAVVASPTTSAAEKNTARAVLEQTIAGAVINEPSATAEAAASAGPTDQGMDTGAVAGNREAAGQPKPAPAIAFKRRRADQPPAGDVTPQLGQAPVGTPTTRGKFESVVRALIGRTNNWRLHLYDTADAAEAAGAPAEALANGAYGWVLADQNGKKHAYFILDRVEAGTELGKFLHEVGAHLGLETILTKAQYTALFQSLVTWADKGRAGDQSLEAQIALRALERIEQAGTPADQTKFEAIAYFIEEAVAAGVDPTALNYKSELGRWFRTLWAAFKKALRKLGVKNIDKLTAQHVVDLAYGAARLELAGHWHGSLPAFRRFDSSYMSTGAGDQWYAWGHYVAKRKGVAEHYRKMVEGKAGVAQQGPMDAFLVAGVPLSKVVSDAQNTWWAHQDAPYGSKEAAIRDPAMTIVQAAPRITEAAESLPPTASPQEIIARAKELEASRLSSALANSTLGKRKIAEAHAWLDSIANTLSRNDKRIPEAQLHRVDTNVLPEETMHWDKPLSEQPQEVQDALEQRVDDWQGRQLITPFGSVLLDGDPIGSEIYARMVAREAGAPQENWRQYAHKSSKAASMFLDSIGIKAMEHWDEPSRGALMAARQYVDPKALDLPTKAYRQYGPRAGDYDELELLDITLDAASTPVARVRWLTQNGRISHVPLYELSPEPNETSPSLESLVTGEEVKAAQQALRKRAEAKASTNLVVFNDKNIHTIGRAPAGDLSRIQYGIDAPLRAMYDKVATQLDDAKLDAKETARRVGLSLMSIQQLASRFKTAGLQAYAKTLLARDMYTTTMLETARDLNANWLPLPKAEAKQLSELQLMVRYNQEKFDPTLGKPPVGYGTALTAPGSPVYKGSSYEIWDRWLALPGDATDPTTAKGLYVAVQNYYKAQNAAMAETVQTMIDDLTAQGADVGVGTKAHRLKALTDLLDALKRPYPIPLVRLGGWHVVGMSDRLAQLETKQAAYQDVAARMARDGTLQTNPDALDPWRLTDDEVEERTKLRKDPAHYVVKGARSASAARRLAGELESQLGHAEWNVNKARLPRNLMGDLPVLDAFRERVAGSMSPEAAAQAEELLRETVFDMLPENSDLKRMLKSEGIYGAEEDTQRVFADTVVPRAHRIAAIKYAQDMADALRQINEDAKGPNKTIERALQNEVVKHSVMAMTYQSNPWVDRALTLSFLNFLGGSVSFLVTNMHQVPVVALPKIAARVGPGRQGVTRAAKALWKALGEVGGLRNKQRMIKIVKSGPGRWHAELDLSRLTPGELAATEEMIRQRVLETTIQQELGDQGLFGPGKLSNVVRTISMPVQASELLNRAAVGLASYRLGMEMYNDQKKATDFAVEMVHDTQIGYSSIDTPRAMESVMGSRPLAKLMFQFWRYRQGMLYLTLSAAYDAYKGETPEIKAEARRVLKGMGAMTALTAGVFEMPLVAGTLGAASLIANALGADGPDDDEPVDLQVALRNMLHDINPAFGEVASKGAWSLLGADMSKRVGMGDLANPLAFARIQGQKGQDDFNAILGALAGAPAGMVGRTLNGIYEMGRGNSAKGIEQIVPLKLAKDMLGALRLSEEGLKTGTGGQIFAPEAITGQEILTRLLGAQPIRVSTYYESNAAIQAQSAATQDARQRLVTEYATAAMRREQLADARERIAAFNQRHPQAGVRITYSTLARATQDRKRLTAKRTPAGILETKQMKPFTEYGRFGEGG